MAVDLFRIVNTQVCGSRYKSEQNKRLNNTSASYNSLASTTCIGMDKASQMQIIRATGGQQTTARRQIAGQK